MGISSVGSAAQALLSQTAGSTANGGAKPVHTSAAAGSSGAASGAKDGDGDHGQEGGVGGKVNVLA